MSRQRVNPNVNIDGTARDIPFTVRNDAARGAPSDAEASASVDAFLDLLARIDPAAPHAPSPSPPEAGEA